MVIKNLLKYKIMINILLLNIKKNYISILIIVQRNI